MENYYPVPIDKINESIELAQKTDSELGYLTILTLCVSGLLALWIFKMPARKELKAIKEVNKVQDIRLAHLEKGIEAIRDRMNKMSNSPVLNGDWKEAFKILKKLEKTKKENQ